MYVLAGALLLAAALVAAAALASGSAQAEAQASPPVSASPPVISGSAVIGQTLTATSGSWAGDPTITFAYQWRRCDSSGASCADISGATGPTHHVDTSDVGFTLRVQVTATNGSGPSVAQSNATPVVAAASTPPPPSRPVNTYQPQLAGSTVEGQRLTGSNGNWSGSTPITYAYHWVRCDSGGGAPDGSNCPAISGANDNNYVLQSADVGHRIRLRVTATNSAGVQTAASNPTVIVAPAPKPAPRNVTEPRVSGATTQNQTLSASVGSWAGASPLAYAFQWLRCDTAGNRCTLLGGQTRSTYALTAADVNARLRVRVTASNSRGSAAATSNASGVVQAAAGSGSPSGPLPAGAVRLANGKYSVPVASVSLPARLIVDAVQFTPNLVRSRSSSIELRVHVVDTRGFVIRDALVFARSTPLVTTSMANQPTGQDGWATLRLAPQPNFPLRNGYNVQFFVRARKAGDNVLGGVSTRRLVQVRTGR